MSTPTPSSPRAGVSEATANDHFKQTFSSWFWGGLTGAVALHFGIMAFWPTMHAEDVSISTEDIMTYEIPPEVEIPPEPERIARPATPVVSSAQIDEDITIQETTFDENPIDEPPAPPTPTSSDELKEFQAITPDMVEPSMRNMREIERALERHYPPLLRDAGVGGVVYVNFWIDDKGRVFKHEVQGSSGYDAFDEAAVKVADIMEFNPAMNRDVAVAVVVTIPIRFQVQ